MANLERLRELYQAPSVPPERRADFFPPDWGGGSGQPYEAASTGRRLTGWQPSRLGPTTNLWSTRDMMLPRCRDLVRNEAWASSACDNFESQCIGTGIKPKWILPDNTDLKLAIEAEFSHWANSASADYDDRLNFYGLQALAARELFEAGEVLVRRHVRPLNWGMRVPVQVQLIEAEQMPIWLNYPTGSTGPLGTPNGNPVRAGIEFDPRHRRVAYHLYREHPGETMFYPLDGLQFMRVRADQMLHVYKPKRAGLLRGEPALSSVVTLLHELDKYVDASVVKKQIQTMFAGFLEMASPDGEILPPTVLQNPNQAPPVPISTDYGTLVSTLETGTIQKLFPGEKVVFPTLPADTDIQTFLSVMLHKFAVGVGATYEQITGDLRGVNLSSIRAGLLDFRRKCEQFVRAVIITQFCRPVVAWWMDEAVLSGKLRLPGYASNPARYLNVDWSLSGWAWIDPLKDVQSKQMEIRSGLTSREAVCAERGEDSTIIDSQQVTDNARADHMGLVYDTDPRRVLIGKEANPVEAPPSETPGGEEEAAAGEAAEQERAAG